MALSRKKSFVITQRQLKKPPKEVPIEFTSLQIVALMEYINKMNFKNIWLVGGAKLISAFYEKGYIDECIITIIRKAIGEGILLPKPILEKKGFIERESVDLGSGMKQLNYISEKYSARVKKE